jgi:hypothetical protein
MGLLSFYMEQSLLAREIDCKNISTNDVRHVKEQAILTLVKSHSFQEFSKKYPKNTKFAFPLEMINVKDSKKCFAKITVYIDDNDHYSLIASFLVENETSVTLLKSK